VIFQPELVVRESSRQPRANLGLRIDVSNAADALEHPDGPEAR
jgi:hypothetical protein